jgi:hypothetical protein
MLGRQVGQRAARQAEPVAAAGRPLPLARRTGVVLAATTAVVLAAAPATRLWAWWRRQHDPGYGEDIPLLFDVNTEATVPTWYNAALLLVVAGLCLALASLRRSTTVDSGVRWLVLAAVFAAMSLDETVALHERLGDVVAPDVAGSGLLRHTWVAAGAVLAVGFAAVCAWALATLPRRLRRGTGAGLAVYLAGALGVEAVSGAVLDRWGDGLAYSAVTLLEEAAEMAGAALVVCALLGALEVRRTEAGGVDVRLAPDVATA